MARPNKQGLDYFPMDVTTDDKFELIEAKHGLIGFGIIVKLYQKIYKEGYYIRWSEEMLLIFKKSINVDINSINVIINDAIKYKIFDEKLFSKYKILTSCGIQKRFLTACDRRKTVDLCKNYIIANISEINVNINWINDDISTQSKEEESKEEESKVIITWRNNFELYTNELNIVKTELISDNEFIKRQEVFHPNVDIILSIEKAVSNFWSTPAGWRNKKKSKTKDLDWRATLINAIDLNKVYKPKQDNYKKVEYLTPQIPEY